jgi:transcriptional regulator with XRE-family HTH domain
MTEHAGKRIGTRLREMEKTQGWLAELVGVSINAVSKWIKTGRISRENAMAVAPHLRMTLDELLGAAAGEEHQAAPSREATTLERLDPTEAHLLQLFRQCEIEGQDLILSAGKFAAIQFPRTK